MAGAPPPLNTNHALFLDFDGTLVDLAPTPDDVLVSAALIDVLVQVREGLGGALALVTGRSLADLEKHISLEGHVAAGSHGLEQRLANGDLLAPDAAIGETAMRLQEALRRNQRLAGALVEQKPWSAALHYRGTPALAETCRSEMRKLLDEVPGWHLLEGDMLVEARPVTVNKGVAVKRLMDLPPFSGRIPVFIGDDVTDEDGIEMAQTLGGYGVKVGTGDSAAEHRLADTRAVLNYLQAADLTNSPKARSI